MRDDRRKPTPLERAGFIAHKAPTWFTVGALVFLGGDRKGQRAALRGGACSAVAAVVANMVLKPIVHRRRPPPARWRRRPPVTSSFPSGHGASQLAFSLGVIQELPVLTAPLGAMLALGHWSMIERGSHYVSDVVAGWSVGIASAWAVTRAWAPREKTHGRGPTSERAGPSGLSIGGAEVEIDGGHEGP